MTVRKTPLLRGGVEGNKKWDKSYHQNDRIYSVDTVACCLKTSSNPFYIIEGDTNENNRKDPNI